MIEHLFTLAFSLFLLIRGATLATRYAVRLAEGFQLSKYVVGFIVVAVISILPETFISINSALAGIPAFGLGALFGSNVADLTLVFALIIIIARRGIRIESSILKHNLVYPFLLLIPILLGLDGYYSRLEGITLIIAGAVFYFMAFKNGIDRTRNERPVNDRAKNILLLLGSMTMLLAGSYVAVTSATELAHALRISPIFIGMLVVGLGTTMPELLFSLKSVKKDNDSLAVGDILGTVLADATIVVGILALLSPFSFPQKIIYVTGTFMVVAAFLLFYFMHTGKILSKKESGLLAAFWVLFVLVEFFISR